MQQFKFRYKFLGKSLLILSASNTFSETAQHRSSSGEASSQEFNTLGNFSKVIDEIESSTEAADCKAAFEYTEKFRDGGPQKSSREAMKSEYHRGMLLSFAQNVCLKDDPAKGIRADPKTAMISPSSSPNDTLKSYLGDKGLLNEISDLTEKNEKYLIHSFSLLMTLGMLESSGKVKEGVDKNASGGRNASEIEAGLFQFSQNSRSFVDTSRFGIYNNLLKTYQDKPEKCLKGLFDPADKKSPDITESGDKDADFQKVMKECPAFAAAYGAVLLRKTDQHNGPLKRKEAEPKIACTKNLEQMFTYIKSNPTSCDGI